MTESLIHRPSGNDGYPTVEQLVTSYESQTSGVTPITRKQTLINYFIRGIVNGRPQSLGTDSTIVTPSSPSYQADIDSLIYLSYKDLPFESTNWGVFIRPDFTFSVRKNIGVNYVFDRQHKYGYGSVNTTPNFPFAKHDYTNVS